MSDCRYYDMCGRLDVCAEWEKCPDAGRCPYYSPMPDVDALLALADELDASADIYAEEKKAVGAILNIENELYTLERYVARRIREALGVRDG